MAFIGKLGHLDIESPWGNAGGVVKTVEDVERMAHTGVGWIEAGSYTLEPRIGNSPHGERVYYHNPETGETYNSLGMPNKGMDVTETEIPEMVKLAHRHNKSLVVNVAPVTEDASNESIELVSRAYEAGADAVLLNAGCPNVVTPDGGRHEILSHNAPAFTKVLEELKPVVENYKPIFVRLSPYSSRGDFHKIGYHLISAWNSSVFKAVFTPNTWPGHKPLNSKGEPILEVPGGIGGKSGPAMWSNAHEQTRWVTDLLRGSGIDVVSSSSIMNANTLKMRLTLGAAACAGTTFFYESKNGWKEDTDRLLSDLANLSDNL